MKEKLRKVKGITLIALVITIIVLLILAGVSIVMLTGENGILAQAQNSKIKTEKAQEEELRKLTALEAATNIENTVYDGVTIPAGFAVSQVEGENTVEDGLVIIDKYGNEFVWIPVTSEENYIRNKTYVGEPISKIAYTDKDYLPKNIQPSLEGLTTDKEIGTKNEEAERKAVLNAGGFYISRYEAGKENIDGKDILVSKKGAEPWDEITQDEAKRVTLNAEASFNSDHVKSALCSGIQWDVVMAYITENDENYDVRTVNEKRHTQGISESEKTGQNENDKTCNIYDLEGNCIEFVAEKTEDSTGRGMTQIIRGGNFNFTFEASSRTATKLSSSVGFGFRFVLYII